MPETNGDDAACNLESDNASLNNIDNNKERFALVGGPERLTADPHQVENSALGGPDENDLCLRCGYPLRNIPNWRCPECGTASSAVEQADHNLFIYSTRKYVLLRVFLPAGFYLCVGVILICCHILAEWFDAENRDYLQLGAIALFGIPVQAALLTLAAIRLTQVQLIRRRVPKAFVAKPARAVFVFIIHLTWMCLISLIILILIVICLNHLGVID